MALTSFAPVTGGSTSTTGGTGITLGSTGAANGDSVKFIATGDPLLTQRSLTFQVKAHRASAAAPGGYTQARRVVVVSIPKTLANGNTTVNTARVEISADPESSDSDVSALRELIVQAVNDSAVDSFFNDLSLL